MSLECRTKTSEGRAETYENNGETEYKSKRANYCSTPAPLRVEPVRCPSEECDVAG